MTNPVSIVSLVIALIEYAIYMLQLILSIVFNHQSKYARKESKKSLDDSTLSMLNNILNQSWSHTSTVLSSIVKKSLNQVLMGMKTTSNASIIKLDFGNSPPIVEAITEVIRRKGSKKPTLPRGKL